MQNVKTRQHALITFRVSRRRHEMYCGHARLCVCLCVCLSAAACLHYCTDPDVTWQSGRECPLVVHYWADLQSVHGSCCYRNITRTDSECMLVLGLCLVFSPAQPPPRNAPDKTARKPPSMCTAVTPGGHTMESSAAACSVRPTAHASPSHALSMRMTQQFFVFFCSR